MASEVDRSTDGQLEGLLDRRFRRPLMSFVLRRVQDPADAEDLTQDVFVRLLRARADGRGKPPIAKSRNLAASSAPMTQFTEDRAIWLARNVLPHEPALRAWLSRWRAPDLDIDDVVQETYAVLAGRASVADIRNPRTYCFQTARSIILMHLRRSRVVSIRAVEDIDRVGGAADTPSPEQQVSDREELHRLAQAIASLPEPGRTALTLRIIEGLTQREIGERLGLSENAAQKQIAGCIRFLMKALGRGGYGGARASKATNKEAPGHDGQAGQQRRD